MKSINTLLLEQRRDFSNITKSFESVGLNTGNLIFRESLMKNLNIANMEYGELCQLEHIFNGMPIVVTDLIWINEDSNFDYLFDRLEYLKDNPFVPMSVGLQSKNYNPNFKLNYSVKRVLTAIQERAVIGVRGEYTASILEKHGIKNIEIIGCPSLYYEANPEFKIEKKQSDINLVTTNFRTIYGSLTINEKHFLTYCANRNYNFVEQTKYEISQENCADINFYNYISKWLHKKKIYFSAEEWKNEISAYDFSIGLRFHGNVVALWNHIPALFIAIDSRTEELTNYFNIPTIQLSQFDDKKPINYYYELADYSEFNKNYRKKFEIYYNFMKKNNLIR